MAKIIDPDDLVMASALGQLGTDGNIFVDVSPYPTAPMTISLGDFGALSNASYATAGVSLQAVYSFLKEEWKVDTEALNLIKFPFPMIAITPEQFEFQDSKPVDAATISYFRDGGFAVVTGGTTDEEYMGVISLGNVNGGQNYYAQASGSSDTTNFTLTEAVNECVKIWEDGGPIDAREYFTIYSREYNYTYGQANQTDIGVTTFTYQAYRFPLSNASDLKITDSDASVGTILPYTDINITYLLGDTFEEPATARSWAAEEVGADTAGRWFICSALGTLDAAGVADYTNNGGTGTFSAFTGERAVSGTTAYRPFNVIVDADVLNNGAEPSTAQIYTKIQYDLRQAGDIDADAVGVVSGKTAIPLLSFVGDTLVTADGTYIDDFAPADKNSIQFYDYAGNLQEFPFVAVGTINWNANLSGDTAGIYKMFFTTDGGGNDFGTVNAIIVNDNDGFEITGTTNGAESASFDYDYDGNIQRTTNNGADAPVTVVAIGYEKAQYVRSSTIIKAVITNSVSLVAALERNYSNPV